MNFNNCYSGMFLKKDQELQGMLYGTIVPVSEERRLMDSFYLPFPRYKEIVDNKLTSQILPIPYLVRTEVLHAFEQYGIVFPQYFQPEGLISLPSDMPSEIRQHEWLYGFMQPGSPFQLPNDINNGLTGWLKESLTAGVHRSQLENLAQSSLLSCSPYSIKDYSTVQNALKVLLEGSSHSGVIADYVEHYLRQAINVECIAATRGIQYHSFEDLLGKFLNHS